MTLPSKVIQTYLTFTAKRWGQFPSITFTNASAVSVVSASATAVVIGIVSGTTTMADIKAAVEAHVVTVGFSANDLFTVSITAAHETDVVKTFVSAVLAGGVAAVKASLTFGPLFIQAVSTGTGGNSVRLKLTAGASSGAANVSVSTNDITVQIEDGVTSFGTIMNAINASTPAAALVLVTATRAPFANVTDPALDSPTSNDPNLVSVAWLSAFTNLAGGLAAAGASVTIQSVVTTANATGTARNGLTVSMTEGATAGAEVVTVDGSGNVSVQIQNGVSTVTQVRTAMNSAGAFSAIYTATGTSSTAVVTVNAEALSGAVGPSPAGGTLGWYTDQSVAALTTSFVWYPFGNQAKDFVCKNDEASGTKNVVGSWDGINNHFAVLPTEQLTLNGVNKTGVYLKYANGAPAFHAETVNR